MLTTKMSTEVASNNVKSNKKLLSFAHRGEAQFFFDQKKFNKSKAHPFLFESDSLDLVITGEGLFNCISKLMRVLTTVEYSQVIQLGVAGALNPILKKNDIVQLSHIYLYSNESLQYHSYSANKLSPHYKSYDGVTVFDRLLSGEKKKALSGFGDVVDRESWGTAYVCEELRIPFSILRIISDEVDSDVNCQLIQSEQQTYSENLYQAFESLENETGFLLPLPYQEPGIGKTESILKNKESVENDIERVLSLESLHWTAAQSSELKNQLRLYHKEFLKGSQNNKQSLTEEPWFIEVISSEEAKKAKSSKILEIIKAHLNPILFELHKKQEKLKQEGKNRGLTLNFDGRGENPEISVRFSFSTQEGLRNKQNKLKEIENLLFEGR